MLTGRIGRGRADFRHSHAVQNRDGGF